MDIKAEYEQHLFTNFQYHLKLLGYPTQMGIWRHVNVLPQCREMISSYRAAVLSTDPSAFIPPTRKSLSVPADVSLHFHWALSCIDFYRFYFLTSDWGTTDVSPVILVPSIVLSCSYWSILLGVITSWRVQCEYRALWIYIFALRGEVYTCLLYTSPSPRD